MTAVDPAADPADRRRARIEAWARETRLAAGLPEVVEDEAILDRVATLLRKPV